MNILIQPQDALKEVVPHLDLFSNFLELDILRALHQVYSIF